MASTMLAAFFFFHTMLDEEVESEAWWCDAVDHRDTVMATSAGNHCVTVNAELTLRLNA